MSFVNGQLIFYVGLGIALWALAAMMNSTRVLIRKNLEPKMMADHKALFAGAAIICLFGICMVVTSIAAKQYGADEFYLPTLIQIPITTPTVSTHQ